MALENLNSQMRADTKHTAANQRATNQRAHGRVKVCGLTHAQYARAAWEAGATYGGLVFAPASARHVTYHRARAICAAAPLTFVGVFVDDAIDDVACSAENLSLGAVQLHGHESKDYILELRRKLPRDTQIWKALHAQDELPNLSATHADKVLLDNFERAKSGAAGVFDWSMLGQLDEQTRQMIVLGGGLCPQNASRAHAFDTWALDVNLGVETSAGIISRPMLERFFEELRSNTPQQDDELGTAPKDDPTSRN
jgi:indole-3-glycerol phosphate synthase/phosphoribosylanthranilate isomerase